MNKIENKQYHETYYTETLENGLQVILWHKPDYQKSLFMMATPFGAADICQVDEKGKHYEHPKGIAHFLEHKMFAMKDRDVMEAFAAMGANVNAFTSYQETVYYASTSGDVKPCLDLLLDFVQELDIDDASVEKEKGIIIQELHMYKEMSDQRLLMELYESLYHKHPFRYDIGGDDESVQSTTKEQLMQCYQLNYHPQNMTLVCVSGEKVETLLEWIKENQNKKQFPAFIAMKRAVYDEPQKVCRNDHTFTMDVSAKKVAVAYKQEGIQDPYARLKLEWAIRFLLDANFTTLYDDYQSWMDEEIINDYCGCDVDFGIDYGTVIFYGETKKEEAFIALCDACMKRICNSEIQDKILEQLKRRYYAQNVRGLNSFDEIAIGMIRNIFQKTDYFMTFDIIKNITMEDIKQAAKQLTMDNQAIVRLHPANK